MTNSRAHYIALAVVWLLIVAYGIFFSALSVQRHRAFLTNASDLGQIDQAIWNSLQGRPLEATRRTGEQLSRLTDHVEPLFVLISPVFLVYDNVEALLILQSFVIAIGALAVFWVARDRLGQDSQANKQQNFAEWAGVLFAAMYLLFPSLQAANLAEFHAVTFVPAFMLFAYHYGRQKKWGRFALFALLLLSVKEEIALLVFMLAGYFAVRDWRFAKERLVETGDRRAAIRAWRLSRLAARNEKRETRNERGVWRELLGSFVADLGRAPRVPLVLMGLSVAWFVVTVFVIIPQFNALGRSPYRCRYVVDADCPEVVRGLLLEQRLGYLGQMLASSGLVSVLDPVSLLLGSPLILANVISNYPAQYSGTFHYSAPVAPYFILAAIGGTAWLARQLSRRGIRHAFSMVVGAAFVLALGYHYLAGYTPIARAYSFPQISERNLLFDRFAAQIPRDARVSTTGSLHPHLSHREFLYRYPVVNDADYVLLDVNESDRSVPSEFRVRYNELLDDGFGILDADDGYILLQRGAPNKDLPDEFYNVFRVPQATPQYSVLIDFGGKVRFYGYDVLTDAYGRAFLKTYWQRLGPLENNYYLVPFLADENGAPIQDLNFPMTTLFWYPTSAWKPNEVVVTKTIPLDWGDQARLALGVVNGFDWNDAKTRLPVTRIVPETMTVVEGTRVDLGTFRKDGNTYQPIP